jgi:hypothetical protein
MYLSRLYGCVVASDLDLHQAPLRPGTPADLTLRRAPDEWDGTWKAEPADLISRRWSEERQEGYLSARTEDGYRLRLDDVCEFDLNAGLDEVVWRVAPGTDPGLVAVVAVGGLMTLKFMLQGELVLHASAVNVGGRGLAFVGRSGMGKSTMATLMCRAGASMVTDDVGRVIFDGDGVRLAAGGRESRLRKPAESLADLIADTESRLTGDGRLALTLPGSTLDSIPLDAVVIPLPTREGTEVTLRALSPAQAVVVVNMFPRLTGLVDEDVRSRQFHQIADLAERVPVFSAAIPWGPPFDPAIPAQLYQEMGWDHVRVG